MPTLVSTMLADLMAQLPVIPPEQPILIAGATASGKSRLAVEIAQQSGGIIVNADALQVFNNWRILTARPSDADQALAPHALYGHVPGDVSYSVGQWLREVALLLSGPDRLIITGGTGLYFSALTDGLAEIPNIPDRIRQQGNALLADGGVRVMIANLDKTTLSRIDTQNPMRVQRAWEVAQTTGRGLAAWQDDTPPPLLPLKGCAPILLDAPRDWLNPRIDMRFAEMLKNGALEEARNNLAGWSLDLPSAKAIGARELIDHLNGSITIAQATESATTATRQFAKRQRSWFRARMKDWKHLDPR